MATDTTHDGVSPASPTDLTQLNLDVLGRRSGGRIIWQPRILAWYYDRQFTGQGLDAPYTGMSLSQLYRSLGCSNRIYEFNECFQSSEDPAVRFDRRSLNETDYEITIHTPVGSQVAVYRVSPNTAWHLPVKWPIASEQEMKVAAWREERRTWRFDQGTYDKVLAEWQGLGAPSMFMPRITLQKLFIDEMGIEPAIFALLDYPAACERYFEALTLNQDRMIDVINASPILPVNFGDNVHGRILPPDLFTKYVLPGYQHRSEKLHRAGKFVYAHWDGDCKPLLPFARQTGMDGIEAITPLPQGDVTLEETQAALGDLFLIDGIPAVYFDHTFSEQTLRDCVGECIDRFAGHLVLGISDEMSATGDIERIRLVGQMVDEYNASR